MSELIAQAEALVSRLRGENPDEGDQICEDAAKCIESLIRAQAEQPAEPIDYYYEWDTGFGLRRSFDPAPYNGMQPARSFPLYRYPDPRIAALERDLAAAQARIERYEALLNRCSDACKVVPVLVRNGEHISLPTHIEKAIGKDRHEGCPRAKAERGDDLAHLRERANALLHQIDIGDYVDSEGHALKNNIAVLTLMKALTNV